LKEAKETVKLTTDVELLEKENLAPSIKITALQYFSRAITGQDGELDDLKDQKEKIERKREETRREIERLREEIRRKTAELDAFTDELDAIMKKLDQASRGGSSRSARESASHVQSAVERAEREVQHLSQLVASRDFKRWNQRDVSLLLEELGLSEYEESFANARVFGTKLEYLTEDSLQDLGIFNPQERKKLLNAIRSILQQGSLQVHLGKESFQYPYRKIDDTLLEKGGVVERKRDASREPVGGNSRSRSRSKDGRRLDFDDEEIGINRRGPGGGGGVRDDFDFDDKSRGRSVARGRERISRGGSRDRYNDRRRDPVSRSNCSCVAL
jgi:Skp family chaperone for outer membrane proteins